MSDTTTPAPAPTFKGKTAAEWRAEAKLYVEREQESWERSDTDGFLSQWALSSLAREANLCARLAESGGMTETTAVFTLDGRVASVDYREGQYGWYWLIDRTIATELGVKPFFTHSKANKAATRRANNAKKGFTLGTIRVKADTKFNNNGAVFAVADEQALEAGEFEVVSTYTDTTDY